jgi:hypothetical protein
MRVRRAAAAGLLGAACVAWSAVPLGGTGGAGTALLVAAAVCTALSTVRLLITAPFHRGDTFGPVARAGRVLAGMTRGASWPEGAVVTVLVLEALHHSRAWHTAMLGAALLAYLLAVHLGESRSRLAVLRPQVPLLAAGLGLLVLAAGAAALPAATGSAADLMVTLAVLAAVIVGGLAVSR